MPSLSEQPVGRDGEVRAGLVVVRVRVRDDHVEAVRPAAQADHDEHGAAEAAIAGDAVTTAPPTMVEVAGEREGAAEDAAARRRAERAALHGGVLLAAGAPGRAGHVAGGS